MKSNNNLKRVFQVNDGYDMRRLLEERELYQNLSGGCRLAPILSSSCSSAELSVTYRPPEGESLRNSELSEPAAKHALFQYLISVESHIPNLKAHLKSENIYIQQRREHSLFDVIIGWHRHSIDRLDWIKQLFPGQEDRVLKIELSAESISELYEGLLQERVLEEPVGGGRTVNLSERVRWLRRAGKELIQEFPLEAFEKFWSAFEIIPDPDLALLALDASARAESKRKFDEVLIRCKDCGVILQNEDTAAMLAWRAYASKEYEHAREHCKGALGSGVDRERALELLVKIGKIQGAEMGEILELHRQLLIDFGTELKLSSALNDCWNAKEFKTAVEFIQLCSFTIESPPLLLGISKIYLEVGDRATSLRFLWAFAEQGSEISESEAKCALELAERSCEHLDIADCKERLLEISQRLLKTNPNSEEIRIAHAFYLLSANYDSECRMVCEALPHSPRSQHLASILHFRKGEYAHALELGLNAIQGGVRDPDLFSTLAQTCIFNKDLESFRQLELIANEQLFLKYPKLKEDFREAQIELNNEHN